MTRISYVVTDELGIHARPAGMLTKLAQGFVSDIKVNCNGKQADAKRLFALMGMGVKQGDSLQIAIDGPDEAQAAQSVEAFLKETL